MKCPKCEAEIAEDVVFCNKCGFKVSGDAPVLSTNALHGLNEGFIRLKNRVSYSASTQILFYLVLIAMIAGIVAMFSVKEASFVYALPAVFMAIVVFYRTVKVLVDIQQVDDKTLSQEFRILMTLSAYCIYLAGFAGLVIGVLMLLGSWKAGMVIASFAGLISAYGGIAFFSFLICSMIFLISSLRK